MVSKIALPWYDVPAREFPAKRWLRQRYRFDLPPLRFRPACPPEQREFPALAWVRARQMDGA